MACRITGQSSVCLDWQKIKYQRSQYMFLCEGNPQATVGFPHKGTETRKMFPFDDTIMVCTNANALQWRHNGRCVVPNHQPHDCLLNCLFRIRSKKTSKLRVTDLCAWNSPGVTGEFPAQKASNGENVSIWWRHHGHMASVGCDWSIRSINSTMFFRNLQLGFQNHSCESLFHSINWRN